MKNKKLKKKFKKIVKYYPKEFYDFSDGVDVSDKDIKDFIKVVVNNLYEGLNFSETANSFAGSGNTIVFGRAYVDDDFEMIHIDIFVSKKYSSFETDIKLKKL